jgi:hypothetical protein
MNFKEISINSSIEEKISWAHACFQEKGDRFLNDKGVQGLLIKYREAAIVSAEQMLESGVVEQCRHCEEVEGGSCCGAGIEDRYSGSLILINLLLDRYIPQKRWNSKSCFFLAQNGCSLLARHVICVNYICRKVMENTDPSRIALLREKEGNELDRLFFLNEAVKSLLFRVYNER